MSWIDFVVLAILLYTTIKGASKGLISQLTWIVALVACFAFAESFSLKLAPTIMSMFPQVEPPLDRWIAMFILYMGFAFASFGVARVLKGWLEKAKFADFDKHLGGIFGLIKGVVICLVVIFFGVTLSESMRETVLASHSGHAAAVIMQRLGPVMPKELAGVIETAQQRLNHDDFHTDDLDGHSHGGIDDFIDKLPQFGSESNDSGFANNGQLGEAEKGGGGFLDGLFGGGSAEQGGGSQPTTPPPVNNNNGTNTGNGSTQTDILARFIGQLPTSIGNDVKNSAISALRNSTPEQQQQLFKQLQSIGGQAGDQNSIVGSVLKNWAGQTLGFGQTPAGNNQNGGSNGGNSSSPFDSPPTNSRPPIATNNNPTNNNTTGQQAQAIVGQVLASMGKIYSDRPDSQQEFMRGVSRQLEGVPTQVQVGVLRDWYADLTNKPGDSDPDPQTRFSTNLDTRILRQLQAAGISPTRLSGQLQQRLDAVRQ